MSEQTNTDVISLSNQHHELKAPPQSILTRELSNGVIIDENTVFFQRKDGSFVMQQDLTAKDLQELKDKNISANRELNNKVVQLGSTKHDIMAISEQHKDIQFNLDVIKEQELAQARKMREILTDIVYEQPELLGNLNDKEKELISKIVNNDVSKDNVKDMSIDIQEMMKRIQPEISSEFEQNINYSQTYNAPTLSM